MPGAPLPATLLQFVEEELALAGPMASRLVASMIDELREPKGSGSYALSMDERRIYFDLSETLSVRGVGMAAAFERELRKRVTAELNEQREGRPSVPLGDALGSLTLMDERQIESDIEISRAALYIRNEAEWELRELYAFTSALMGQAMISADTNPMNANHYAGALWDSTMLVTLVPGLRSVLMKVGSRALTVELKKGWAAAATRLEDRGVERMAYKTMASGSVSSGFRGGAAPSAPLASTPPMAAQGSVTPMAPQLPPQGLRPGSLPPQAAPYPAPYTAPPAHESSDFLAPDIMAGVFGPAPPAPAAAVPAWAPPAAPVLRPMPTISLNTPPAPAPRARSTEQTLDQTLALLDLEVQVLAPQEQGPFDPSAPPLALPRLSSYRDELLSQLHASQQQSADVLIRLFDALLSDARLPLALRLVLVRLQTPVFRMGLQHRRILEQMDLPVWIFVNTLAEAASSYPQPDDPRLLGLLGGCHAVLDELARQPSPDDHAFITAVGRLHDVLEKQLQAQLTAAAGQINTLHRVEHRDRLHRELSARLTEQLAMLRISATLRRFITGQWSLVMAETIVRYGQNSDRAVQAFSVIDDLVWSLQTRGHPGALKRLMDLLPSLVQRLRLGMVLVGLSEADQQLIMNELMELHTAAVRSSFKPGEGRPLPEVAHILSAEEIVRKLKEEAEGGTPSSMSGFGQSLIDVQSMDTVPAELLDVSGTPAQAQRQLRPEHLAVGMRLRVFLAGRWSRVQMLWRSEAGQHFLFASESPGRTHSMTLRALDRLCEENLVLFLEDLPLVQRSLGRVLKVIGVR
jgi:hypothetical protein